MKKSFLPCMFVVLATLAGCAPISGRIAMTSFAPGQAPKTVLLSEYFEAREYTAERRLLAHLIVTLGKERMPPGHKSKLSWTDRRIHDFIEEAQEVYFTNNTDQPVRLNNVRISYYGTEFLLLDKEVVIAPKSFYKTPVRVGSTSLYRGEKMRKLTLEVNGALETLMLRERRTPVDELGQEKG